MFKIIQSHRTECLVEQLLLAYKSKDQPIFEEFIVIVPSMVLGEWLDKSIASQVGISTLVTTTFWGQYQWTLMQKVLAEHNSWLERQGEGQSGVEEVLTVPEVAVLTGAVMQWRLFGYFTYYQAQIMADDKHPLYPLLTALLDEDSESSQQDIRLWSLASDFSRVFSRYLTHRDDWLTLWSQDKAVNVEDLIAKKDELAQLFNNSESKTPEWLVAHYVELEAAQRHLWRLLFAAVYEHRAAIEARFWQIMAADTIDSGVDVQSVLPSQLHIFTIQQLPQSELNFLQQLSLYCDITLLHYNPSQLFWADIVDKQWLQRQQVVNPESVFLRDYGHTLLSRLGKQSRETFAMLASLSGNEHADGFVLDWQDKFTFQNEAQDDAPLSLLAHLQQDILMLDESATQSTTATKLSTALGKQMQLELDVGNNPTNDTEVNSLSSNKLKSLYSDSTLEKKHHEQSRQWRLSQYDNSLSIHSCHNLQRQLEILRGMIGKWLNENTNRHLSDIVVLLPDVEQYNDLITSIFVNGKGQDGLTLPAKVTGVVDKSIRQLWNAISGFYTLLDSETARFEAAVVLDWLMLPPLYESLGLTHEQMARGCDLLQEAGFIRGFDEAHLQQSLDSQDYDYRFSFSYALDQIALGLLMPEADITGCLYPNHWQTETLEEKTLPMSAISLADVTIVEALCRVHSGLNQCRDDYKARYKAEEWLNRIENNVIHPYFGVLDQTRPMRAIFNAMNGFKSSLRANRHYQRYHVQPPQHSQSHDADHHTTHHHATEHKSFTNTQVEAQLSKVNTLTLKLSFMLNSIEEELESQQVSAEPTGVITFGRFGALRNVPFELVVMLNMDLSEFPKRDRDNRYDLMKAGLARRGDRFSEDDDNGAFLDAVLCARDACWIFYNGQRLTDTHEHLPANPVSELLQFLQGEVQWQWEPLNDNQNDTALAAQVQHYLPNLIEQWLVTKHPALPFAEEVFVQPQILSHPIAQDNSDNGAQTTLSLLEQAMQREKLSQQSTQAPAKVWERVFERLHEQQAGESHPQLLKVKLPSKADYTAIAQFIECGSDSNIINIDSTNDDIKVDIDTQTDMQQLYYQVRHPAKHFLKEQRVHIVLPSEDTVYQEPLSLSGLSAYGVNEQLLSEMQSHIDINNDLSNSNDLEKNSLSKLKKLNHKKEIPAGSKRQSTIKKQQESLEKLYQEFNEQLIKIGIKAKNDSNLSLITPCNEKLININIPNTTHQTQQLKGNIPSDYKDAKNQILNLKPKLWLNVSPSSARASHLLRFWLLHNYWQVARKTTHTQVADQDGRSIWRFNKGSTEYKNLKNITTFSLAPIDYDTALTELLKWVRFANISGQLPLVILPRYAISYLDNIQKAQDKGTSYEPKRSDFSSWLTTDFNSDVIYDTCSQHELWQYILQNHDAFTALTDSLATLTPLLFSTMNEALEPID